MTIHGTSLPAFAAVREEFERNFAERGEVGASVCVLVDGELVVDLWGGLADKHDGRAWQEDTIGVVWSSTKGATALCAHMLVARGLLDLDAPVSQYWPEFAQNGKEAITPRLILSHQAGLPVFTAPLKPGGLYDWEYCIKQLEAQAPLWPPGTRQAYHAVTFGHLVGELTRRISGVGIGEFFRTEVAEPLGLDFWLGLPAEHEGRVAATIRPEPAPRGEPVSPFLRQALQEPGSIAAQVVRNTGRREGVRDHDSLEAHAAVLPSQGAITNARSLARMYAPLALDGQWNGVRLLQTKDVKRMAAVASASAEDATLQVGMRFGLGFMKSADNRRGPAGARDSLILGEAAFGHAGMGGSLGFADPTARLAFGYTMNKQGRDLLLNERGQALVDAAYRAVGFTSNEVGFWV
jgi:CubicO group peptidase (beta-lactamase class C family)